MAAPTPLAVAESRRLIETLNSEAISVRHLVVNKLIDSGVSDNFMNNLRKGQESAMARLDKPTSGLHHGREIS